MQWWGIMPRCTGGATFVDLDDLRRAARQANGLVNRVLLESKTQHPNTWGGRDEDPATDVGKKAHRQSPRTRYVAARCQDRILGAGHRHEDHRGIRPARRP